MFLDFIKKHWSSLLMGAAVAALFFLHPPAGVFALLKIAVASSYLAPLGPTIAANTAWFLFTTVVFLITSSVVVLGHEVLDFLAAFPVQAVSHPLETFPQSVLPENNSSKNHLKLSRPNKFEVVSTIRKFPSSPNLTGSEEQVKTRTNSFS